MEITDFIIIKTVAALSSVILNTITTNQFNMGNTTTINTNINTNNNRRYSYCL